MGQILRKLSLLFFCVFSVLLNAQGTDYVSFPMMNLDIKHTLEEHNRQVTMHRKQVLNTSTEVVNRGFWDEVKEVKRKIQKRLHIIDFTLQSIPTGYKLYQDSRKIAQYQESIFNELQDAPYLVTNVFNDQIRFLDELQMITRFIVGVVASYGSINQMERAERQVLLNHALSEVRRLKTNSVTTLLKIRDIKAKLRLQGAAFDYRVNRDKQLVEDVLNNIGL